MNEELVKDILIKEGRTQFNQLDIILKVLVRISNHLNKIFISIMVLIFIMMYVIFR